MTTGDDTAHDIHPEATGTQEGRMTTITASADELVSAYPAGDRRGSDTLFNGPGARVILLTFPAGEGLAEHAAPVPILLQVVSGRLTIEAAGDAVELRAGGTLHMTTGLRHSVVAHEDSNLAVILLRGAD